MGADKYNRPAEGTAEWHIPLNENFSDLGIEVVGEVETFEDLPTPDSSQESSNGGSRKYLVRNSRIIYRDSGSGWEPIAGFGSSDSRVSGTVYHERHDTNEQVVSGKQLYIQDSEPANPSEGDVWIDIS